MPAAAFSGFYPLIISPWNGDILWTEKRPFYYKLIVKYVLKNADAVTADNRVMKEICIKYGVREDKIKVILWFGTDTNIFKPLPEDYSLKKRLSLDGTTVVLCTRSICAQYNIDTIVRAIPLVLRQVPKAKFIFIWYSGDRVEEIKDMVNKLSINDSVFFLGRLDNYFEIPRYYSISQVAVSIASPDSTPASLLEAMACGVAPIVSNEPAIIELIKDNWNGIVVSPKDHKMLAEALTRLINNPDQRQLFAERNLKLVREIGDFDKNMKKIEELYYRLIEKRALGKSKKHTQLSD
jgi:glycosyltransferase involved in cell wall biosynthesis